MCKQLSFSKNRFDGKSHCGQDIIRVRKQTENAFSVQPEQTIIEAEATTETHPVKEKEPLSCNTGNFVEAVYDSKCYIGKLIENDETDYYFDFMVQSGNAFKQFRWPSNPDRILVNCGYVLRISEAAVTWLKYCRYGLKLYAINQSINIEEHVPTGKDGQMFMVF